jgi:hypothetical protein
LLRLTYSILPGLQDNHEVADIPPLCGLGCVLVANAS